jgi:hypothetical protein
MNGLNCDGSCILDITCSFRLGKFKNFVFIAQSVQLLYRPTIQS